ncbi:MAG: RluA family pseudouridine synthase [candidate division SR1 bacterium]|nr:RluA family pseudouridine synthase [candidate division SR1 bacterium]
MFKKKKKGDISTTKTERIDTRLSKQFSYSRSFFHHIIERGGVKVNGKVVKKSYQLKHNDDVEIDDVRRYLSPVILDEAPDIKIPVMLEKEDYLIINKPKGVLSHPKTVREIHEPSVVGFLYHTYKNLPTIGNFIRAGLIHRLDKNTDGLMIIAKTEKGLEHFKKLFQSKSESKHINEKEQTELKKFYRATSYLTEEGKKFIDGIHEFPFMIQELVIAKLPHTMSKIGITKIIEIVKKTDTTITLNLEILTGRTHQIRYHLSHHGLPIVGDYLYGDEQETEPMQLTAYKLICRDPENEIVTVEI